MDAAEAARPEEAHADGAADGERRAGGRRAELALRRTGGEVARADLACVGRIPEPLELLLREADLDDPVDDPDRRRDGPGGADAPLGLRGDRGALSAREAVRDKR